MHSPETMLDRYAAGSLQTATGPRIVVMCFDRLDKDLTLALAAIDLDDHYEANRTLAHAQDLLTEMADMLDVDAWDHAGALLALYDYILRRLAQANSSKNPGFVIEVQQLITSLGDAFREAATSILTPAADLSGDPSDSTDPTDRPRLSVQA